MGTGESRVPVVEKNQVVRVMNQLVYTAISRGEGVGIGWLLSCLL